MTNLAPKWAVTGPKDPSWWSRIDFAYRDMTSMMRSIEAEPSPSATNKLERSRMRSYADNGLGTLLQFRPTDDPCELVEYKLAALAIAEELEPLIAKRELTPHFAQRWGAFCFAYGISMQQLYAGRKESRVEKLIQSNTARSNAQERTWMAHEMLPPLEQRVPRNIVEKRVYSAITQKLNEKTGVSEKYARFLKGLLAKDQKRLKSSYRGNNFSRPEMRRLLDTNCDELPPPLNIPLKP